MTIANTSVEDRALLAGWVDFGGGIHATRSNEIIQQALWTIQRQHIFCTVVAKGYESGKVVLIEFGPDRLVVDRPLDWPLQMGSQSLKIVFKSRNQLWNQFVVELIEVTVDSLITSMPRRYISLQRRDFYRVAVPPNSRAVFYHKGESISQLRVENISVNGALFCAEDNKYQRLSGGELLTDITMFFPDDKNGEIPVKIKKGRVARTDQNERRHQCFGVHFLLDTREERGLLQHVRLRERELLRKGLINQI